MQRNTGTKGVKLKLVNNKIEKDVKKVFQKRKVEKETSLWCCPNTHPLWTVSCDEDTYCNFCDGVIAGSFLECQTCELRLCTDCEDSIFWASRDLVFKAVAKISSEAEAINPDVREIILRAVRSHGLAIQFAPAELQGDFDIAKAAVQQDGMALKWVSEELRASKPLVLQAVEVNGMSLQFAQQQCRENPQISIAAVKQNNDALVFVPPHLRRLVAKVANDAELFAMINVLSNELKLSDAKELREEVQELKDELRATNRFKDLLICDLRIKLNQANQDAKAKDVMIVSLERTLKSAHDHAEEWKQKHAAAVNSANEWEACFKNVVTRMESSPPNIQDRACVHQPPYLQDVQTCNSQLSRIKPSSDPVLLPVAALRFTHATINSHLAFGEDHDNCQESIFKLIDALFRGHLEPAEVEPLHVFIHEGPDGVPALYSRNNRRMFALLCHQAVRRDTTIKAHCIIHRPYDKGRSPIAGKSLATWFREGYDDGLGWSIWPRDGRTCHRGYQIFSPVATTCRVLKRACDRQRANSNGRRDVTDALSLILATKSVRPVNEDADEETLTFCSGGLEDGNIHIANSGRQSERRWGRHI